MKHNLNIDKDPPARAGVEAAFSSLTSSAAKAGTLVQWVGGGQTAPYGTSAEASYQVQGLPILSVVRSVAAPIKAPEDWRTPRPSGGTNLGFTLIELLTVISIIGLLAGMLVGLAPSIQRTMKTKRVQTELNQLVMAIENYHSKFGHYPPDNLLPTTSPVVDVVTNQLYYELTGWVYDDVANPVGALVRGGTLYKGTVQNYFHRGGFANSSANPTEVRSFLPNLKPNQIVKAPGGNVELLAVPVAGPSGNFNVWRYNSSSPTNNPGKFDLWAEYVIGRQTNVVGNWKQ